MVVVGVGDATVAAAAGEKLPHRGVRRRGEGGERRFEGAVATSMEGS